MIARGRKASFVGDGFRSNSIFDLNSADLNVCRSTRFSLPSHVLLYESPQILPINGDAGFLERYRRVFTWRDDLVDSQRDTTQGYRFSICYENAAMHDFLASMTETQYISYQDRIAAFLTGEGARPFSAEAFADTIVNTIASDLGLTI